MPCVPGHGRVPSRASPGFVQPVFNQKAVQLIYVEKAVFHPSVCACLTQFVILLLEVECLEWNSHDLM